MRPRYGERTGPTDDASGYRRAVAPVDCCRIVGRGARWVGARGRGHAPGEGWASACAAAAGVGDERCGRGRAFYVLVLMACSIGVALDFANVNPVQALYWTSILNGLLAPFLLLGILITASDRVLMQGQPSSMLGRFVVALTTLVMFGAAFAMFVF